MTECKFSAQNTVLEKKLEEKEKRLKEVLEEERMCREMNQNWCDKVDEKIDNMETKFSMYQNSSKGLNLENRIFSIFKHYEDLLDTKGMKPALGQCSESCCNQHLSSLWKYCPNCGKRVYSDEDNRDKFRRISKKLDSHGIKFIINNNDEPIMVRTYINGKGSINTSTWSTDAMKVMVEFVEEFTGARLHTVSKQFKSFLKEMEAL